MPVFLHECEAWSLTLRGERKLRVCENSILRRIFRFKRDANVEYARLQNEERHNLYRSPNVARLFKSRRFRWASYVARMEESRNAFKILTGRPSGNIYLGRAGHRGKDNIRVYLMK